MNPRCLVITPIEHIDGVKESLESFCEITIYDDPNIEQVSKIINDYDAIFTNPNKSKIYLGSDILELATKLKVIATASTGTNHIDKQFANNKNIQILSLTEEREVIQTISSTAEHAFALTLSSLRKVVTSHNKALLGQWDYTEYIGRQMDFLTIGIIGYGRLGSLYARYCKAFGSKVLIYDPYVKVRDKGLTQVESIATIAKESDVISLHVHVNEETTGMINKKIFSKLKNDVLIVNTSRGEIVNEIELVEFLSKNRKALFASDVLADEIKNRTSSPIFKYAKENQNQVTITQHIGGMTKEAQQIAYRHAAKLLKQYFMDK